MKRHLLIAALSLAALPTVHAQPASAPTLSEQIDQQQRCVAGADQMIKRQHEIGREAGVVDKNALYVAGADKVRCKHNLQYLQACKRSGKCNGLPADPSAPTRINYKPLSGDMP
jgi:hypothetical protein